MTYPGIPIDMPEGVLQIGNREWWECGYCHHLTNVTHFYEDHRGVMQHYDDTIGKGVLYGL